MNVDLGYLQAGDWRELTDEEMKEINNMISSSSKTEEASVVKEKPKQTKPKRNKAPTKNDFNKKSASFRKSSTNNKRTSTGFSSKKKRK
jgi:23S rRNA pseudouridine2604 synthase